MKIVQISMKKQKCEKEGLLRPVFGGLGSILGPAGGPGGSPKCKKEASEGSRKTPRKKSVGNHRESTATSAKKGYPYINTSD